jgi:hypothetical protein
VSLPATSSAPHDVSVFASRQQTGNALVIVLLNKGASETLPATVRLEGLSTPPDAVVRVFCYGEGDPLTIRRLGERRAGTELEVELPPATATLLHFLPGSG